MRSQLALTSLGIFSLKGISQSIIHVFLAHFVIYLLFVMHFIQMSVVLKVIKNIIRNFENLGLNLLKFYGFRGWHLSYLNV